MGIPVRRDKSRCERSAFSRAFPKHVAERFLHEAAFRVRYGAAA